MMYWTIVVDQRVHQRHIATHRAARQNFSTICCPAIPVCRIVSRADITMTPINIAAQLVACRPATQHPEFEILCAAPIKGQCTCQIVCDRQKDCVVRGQGPRCPTKTKQLHPCLQHVDGLVEPPPTFYNELPAVLLVEGSVEDGNPPNCLHHLRCVLPPWLHTCLYQSLG